MCLIICSLNFVNFSQSGHRPIQNSAASGRIILFLKAEINAFHSCQSGQFYLVSSVSGLAGINCNCVIRLLLFSMHSPLSARWQHCTFISHKFNFLSPVLIKVRTEAIQLVLKFHKRRSMAEFIEKVASTNLQYLSESKPPQDITDGVEISKEKKKSEIETKNVEFQ